MRCCTSATFVEMQALRPLSLSRSLDYLFAHPQYRDHLDVNRVGGFGASQGGESLLLMTGAKLTITVGMSSKQVLADPRLKAIVGYVPYLGQPFFPAFGRDQSGLDGIATPFLAISGGADLTAPLETTLEGVDRMAGSRDVVVLAGVDHGFDYASTDDIFTWSMTFLAAHVNDDRAARVRIARMTTVRGGGDDFLVRDYTAPAALLPGELDTIEYFGAALGDYFLTAAPEEAAVLDAGLLPGWTRTGFAFKSWSTDAGHGVPVCRFFGKPGPGPYAHFYTIDPVECAFVAASPAWIFEGMPFSEDPPAAGDCPADRIPVMRLYNNFMNGQVGHRYLTSKSEIIAMIADGWLYEGSRSARRLERALVGLDRFRPEDLASAVAGIVAPQRRVPGEAARTAHVDQISVRGNDLAGPQLDSRAATSALAGMTWICARCVIAIRGDSGKSARFGFQ